MQPRPMRLVYFVSAGTIERTFVDGTMNVVHGNAGETQIREIPLPYSWKNIGTTTIYLISVDIK